MFDQLKKYFYLYRKDIFYNIVFLVLFILFLSLFVKICLIDTGIINIIDSTKINIPLDSDLNNSKKSIVLFGFVTQQYVFLKSLIKKLIN